MLEQQFDSYLKKSGINPKGDIGCSIVQLCVSVRVGFLRSDIFPTFQASQVPSYHIFPTFQASQDIFVTFQDSQVPSYQ